MSFKVAVVVGSLRRDLFNAQLARSLVKLAPADFGAEMRFRAVLMTSIAFILGLVPLVWAKGASQIARHDVSTPVFVGMIAATCVGLFLIPMLYVTFEKLREGAWLGRRQADKQDAPRAAK